jgi:hypothetical protein
MKVVTGRMAVVAQPVQGSVATIGRYDVTGTLTYTLR